MAAVFYIYTTDKQKRTKMEKAKPSVIFNTPTDNFFIKCIAPKEYEESSKKLEFATKPPVKKVYRNLSKMLQECYFVGSLKYGNNFIV